MNATDFIEPQGSLTYDLFPVTEEERKEGLDSTQKLQGLLHGWIGDAEKRTDHEEGQEHWVYHRAASHIATRLYGGVQRLKVDGGDTEVQYDMQQMQHWQNEANRHLAAFHSLIRGPQWPRVHALR